MVAIRLVSHVLMRIGGCGAEIACESSLYFCASLTTKLYPFDADDVKREESRRLCAYDE